MSYLKRIHNLLVSELVPYIRTKPRKSNWQQFRECQDLWRMYDCFPYQYFKHRLYERDTGKDYRLYFPPEVVGRFQRAINPAEHVGMVSDKHRTGQLLAAKGLPVIKDIAVFSEGKAFGDDDVEIPLGEALDLIKRHGVVFVKPFDGGSGDNARAVHTAPLSSGDLASFEQCVVQPVVVNHPIVAEMHPQSLNTIRFDTLVRNNRAVISAATLKLGTKGSHIDNWSKGGIAIGIDLATGRLMSIGFMKQRGNIAPRELHLRHPETKIRFEDVVLPYWQEACRLAEASAVALLPHRSLGWDIAITPDGPVVVETNETGSFFLLQESCGGLGQTPLCLAALEYQRTRELSETGRSLN
jgi:hypothetical protein